MDRSFHRFNALFLALVTLLSVSDSEAFVSSIHGFQSGENLHRNPSTQLQALPCPLPSLLAGSIAGAIGVGVAFPLDTIKTKAQILAIQETEEVSTSTLTVDPNGRLMLQPTIESNNLFDVIEYIWKMEGIAGFFGGVQTSMIGQAIIKAVVFAVNAYMLDFCRDYHVMDGNQAGQLLLAAATAGFVTSFLAAPVDRIKVLMQAGGHSYQGQESMALTAVLDAEGWKGLMSRGLGATMMREIPAYTMYFSIYGGLSSWTPAAEFLGPAWVPPIFGAIAGCACWIPIYPIDVIKTVLQNTDGDKPQMSILQVTAELYRNNGAGVFWEGIEARLLRQAINHGVTFTLYDSLLNNVFLKI